jgi:hypothetical protein
MILSDWLRKGFGYVLLTMGVSRPAPKQKPEAKPEAKPESKSETGLAPKPKSGSQGN